MDENYFCGMNKLTVIIFAILLCIGCSTSKQEPQVSKKQTPKLIVGVVVDQMRYDFLTRYSSNYTDGGFKRLMKGVTCVNHHFSYMPTNTGPGHASIYTGLTPSTHGIIANDWFDHQGDSMVNCISDPNATAVEGNYKKGKASPKRLLVNGLGDYIKKRTVGKGKVIGISLKDRGAILPVGKHADAAYWYHGKEVGEMISSSYYMSEYPSWVKEFNALQLPDKYLSQVWNPLLDTTTYESKGRDNQIGEESIDPDGPAVFPYDLQQIRSKKSLNLLKYTPFGNDYLLDFAMATIENEKLGQDSIVDLLTISFSSTDHLGHKYGPRSMEIEDTYIRLDRNIRDLLTYLDETVGEGEYVLFLTADHGVADVPVQHFYSSDSGYVDQKWILERTEEIVAGLHKTHPDSSHFISSFSNYQFFLDKEWIRQNGYDIADIADCIQESVKDIPGYHSTLVFDSISNPDNLNPLHRKVWNGWNKERSGQIALIMQPGWISSYYQHRGGSAHGSAWEYDTHVPFMVYGTEFTGIVSDSTYVQDIVPTIYSILGDTTDLPGRSVLP